MTNDKLYVIFIMSYWCKITLIYIYIFLHMEAEGYESSVS